MARSDATLSAIEAAYAPIADEQEWLSGILDEVQKFGLGDPCGYCVEPLNGVGLAIGMRSQVHIRADAHEQLFGLIPPSVQLLAHAPAPRVEGSEARGARLERVMGLEKDSLTSQFRGQMPPMLGMLGINAEGSRGVVLGIVGRLTVPSRTRRQLDQLAVHAEGSFRLRAKFGLNAASAEAHTPADATSHADAIFSADGALKHMVEGAAPHRESLALAVKALDRSRGQLRRLRPDEAADSWTAMVDGTWTLLDHTQSDGRRLILAVQNAPQTTIGGLTRQERQVATYAALGHSQKHIAYELGLKAPVVSRLLKSALGKLKLANRAALIQIFGPLARFARTAWTAF